MFTGPILCLNDVKAFFTHIVNTDKVSFRPDEDFTSYVSVETRKPSFTEQQAANYNALMEAAFVVCEKEDADIYEVGLELLKGTSHG